MSPRALAEFLAPLVAVGAVTAVLLATQTDDEPSVRGERTPTKKPAPRAGSYAAVPVRRGAQRRVVLTPIAGQPRGTGGSAVISKTPTGPQISVVATLPDLPGRRAYEVWLYNSRRDARSVGAQRPDASGTLQGAGPLPKDYRRFKYLDVSRERLDTDRRHSGRSVLRGKLR